MNRVISILRWCVQSTAPRSATLIRLLVGSVFVSEGIQKFLFPSALGSGRFQKIGIPAPHFMGPFVAVVEVVFGSTVLLGILTRLSAIPLLAVIVVAIATTKIVMLPKVGFWAVAHDGRADYSMLMGLLFLFVSGAGPHSFDSAIERHLDKSQRCGE